MNTKYAVNPSDVLHLVKTILPNTTYERTRYRDFSAWKFTYGNHHYEIVDKDFHNDLLKPWMIAQTVTSGLVHQILMHKEVSSYG